MYICMHYAREVLRLVGTQFGMFFFIRNVYSDRADPDDNEVHYECHVEFSSGVTHSTESHCPAMYEVYCK